MTQRGRDHTVCFAVKCNESVSLLDKRRLGVGKYSEIENFDSNASLELDHMYQDGIIAYVKELRRG